MKRLFFVIAVIFFISISCIKSNNYSEFLDDDSYNLYSLFVEDLSTNNFLDYFSNLNVMSIYPYINPIYQKNVGEFYYKIKSAYLSYEIDSFRSEFLNLIKKNSYMDYNFLFINGIKISRVDVYMSGNDLYNFLNNSGLVVRIEKVTNCCV
jgi:hypothetical protein